MALVVEDGTGLPDAEAYASVAEADAYFAARGNVAWGALSEQRREECLRLGCDYMEAVFGRLWRSVRLTDGQALAWPRVGWHGVPQAVARANMELAFRASASPLLDDQGPQVAAETVGPISVAYAADAREGVRYVHVWKLLGPYLDAGRIQVRRA